MNSKQILAQQFVQSHPIDTARILEQLPVEDVAVFLAESSAALAAQAIKHMAPLTAAACLNRLSVNEATAITAELEFDFAAIILRRLDDSKRSAILDLLQPAIAGALGILLQHPKNTAGAVMNPNVFTLFDDITVKEALRLILKGQKRIYYHIPVINRQQLLVGITDMSRLLQAKASESVFKVSDTSAGYLLSNLSREAMLVYPDWQIYHDLPVVNENGIFLGIVDYRTIRRLENELRTGKTGIQHDTGKALGELYWLGLSAFFKGAASAVNPDKQ